MALSISFEHDIARLSKDLARVKEKAIPTATRQALNRTAKGVKTDSVRHLAKITGVKQADIRKEIRVFQATKAKLTAKVDAYLGRARNLINFVTASQRKPKHFNSRTKRGKYRSQGVRARAWGKQKTYKGTFIGTSPQGNPLVFARQGKSRLPLKSIKGPSIRTEFDKPDHKRRLQGWAQGRFEKEMAAAVNNQLRRLGQAS